jgi:glycosyltransferase involved in cell wall biosynthesis
MAEDIVELLVKRIRSSVSSITDNFEIVLVDDGSRDGSWRKIEEQSKQYVNVIGVKLSRNFGQHYAMSAGMAEAKGDWIILMDCDLQDPPEEIPRLFKKAQEGYNIVLAVRTSVQEGFTKRMFSKLFYKVFEYFTDTNMESISSSMKLISRQVADSFNSMHERHRFFGGMLGWLGYKTAHINIEHAKRPSGKSSYDFKKRFNMATMAIVSFSVKPLLLAIRLGLLLILLSGSYILAVVIRNLIYKTTAVGWSSLIASIFFATGMLTTLLGIIGLYVGKIFEEVKKRPVYVVEQITNR